MRKKSKKYISTLRRNNTIVIKRNGIYKTNKNMGFDVLDPLRVKHNGIDDCLHQIKYCTHIAEPTGD